MDDTTSMLIDASEFVTDGDFRGGKFLIVLIGAEDEVCNFKEKQKRKFTCAKRRVQREGVLEKNVTITLEPIAGIYDRLAACSTVFVGYLAFAVFCILASGWCFKLDKNEQEPYCCTCIGPEDNCLNAKCWPSWLCRCRPQKDKTKTKTLEKRTGKIANPEESKARYKKNQLYMGGLLIISIFYAVTVLQTAFDAQKTQYETGNNDICYFNARCQNPLLYSSAFLDFNHFYSNIGYVMLGLTFNLIVFLKDKEYQKHEKNLKQRKIKNMKRQRLSSIQETNESNEETKNSETKGASINRNQENRESYLQTQELRYQHGVPFLTGVYYSMGAAMAMEGLMSAAYHICPTTVSFQFDTTFMYLIAILIYVKLYQNRHPDSSASSVKAYLVLGLAIALEAISIYSGMSPVFWTIFCGIYILGVVCIVANIYQLDSRDRMKSERKYWLDSMLFFRVYRLLFKETWNTIKRCYGQKSTKPTLDQTSGQSSEHPCSDDQNPGPSSMDQSTKPRRRPLLVFIFLLCIVNIGLCAFFAVVVVVLKASSGASNYILCLFMLNMHIYLGYYLFMKYKSNEWLQWRPKVYLGKKLSSVKGFHVFFFAALGLLCTGFAMSYFLDKEKNTNLSPAESRDLNQPCRQFKFYDR